MGISRSESGEFSFRFWGFSIDKTQLASNAVVSSLFDRFHLSDARPSLDARSGTNVVGLIPHFYSVIYPSWSTDLIVSMPSRAYISFLRLSSRDVFDFACRCQCPLGLISHFYRTIGCDRKFVIPVCQCPLGLISHFYWRRFLWRIWGWFLCQCPLGLISHFYGRN